MQDMQKIFEEIREAKGEMKGIRASYRDALAQTDKYEEVNDEIKKMREEKKTIEAKVQNEMGKTYARMEDLKSEVAGKEELLNDIAISTLMKGGTVEVKDEFDNQYEPVYAVRFKKTNVIQKEF